MSDEIKDGGPAFPYVYEHQDSVGRLPGMTLRDYFAAKAMQGMISAITNLREDGIIENTPQDISELAYLYADTMLKTREKEGAKP